MVKISSSRRHKKFQLLQKKAKNLEILFFNQLITFFLTKIWWNCSRGEENSGQNVFFAFFPQQDISSFRSTHSEETLFLWNCICGCWKCLTAFFFWWGGESQSLQNRGCWLKMRCSGPSLQFDHWQWSSVFPSGKQTFSMFMCSSWIWLKTFSRYSTIHFWILNYTINIYWIPVFFYFLRVYTTLLLKSILFSESGPF